MNRFSYLILFLVISLVLHGNNTNKIDRKSLVQRHNITDTGIGDILALGNGKFCFGVDATGLQTFGGNIMCDWSWHNYPYNITPDYKKIEKITSESWMDYWNSGERWIYRRAKTRDGKNWKEEWFCLSI